MAETPNLTNLFLLLPSLVRDEIYSHLLPARRTIWLSRNVSRSHRYVDARRAGFRGIQFQKRQLEQKALSHWYPGATGLPTPEEMSPQTEGYMYGRNADDIRHILVARLVCRQVAAEVDIIFFRRVTLWWTLWDAGLPFVESLAAMEDLPVDGDAVPRGQRLACRVGRC